MLEHDCRMSVEDQVVELDQKRVNISGVDKMDEPFETVEDKQYAGSWEEKVVSKFEKFATVSGLEQQYLNKEQA